MEQLNVCPTGLVSECYINLFMLVSFFKIGIPPCDRGLVIEIKTAFLLMLFFLDSFRNIWSKLVLDL
jgi:hypothetical protein